MNAKHISALTAASFVAASLLTFVPVMGQAATEPANSDNGVIATINNAPISEEVFDNLLMQVAGIRVFEEARDWVLVQQACAQAGISTSDENFKKAVQAEMDRTLTGIGAQFKLTSVDQERGVLMQTLRQKGVQFSEFQLGLQKAAGLRILAKGKIHATEDQIKAAFANEYGEKYNIALIPVQDAAAAARVTDLVNSQKVPVADLTQHGYQVQDAVIAKSAKNLGVLGDELPKLKAGELSPMIEQSPGHNLLVYVKSIDPAQNVPYETVKDKVKTQLEEEQTVSWMNQHLRLLQSMATVNIKNPTLKKLVDQEADLQNRLREAATAPAATQPAASATK